MELPDPLQTHQTTLRSSPQMLQLKQISPQDPSHHHTTLHTQRLSHAHLLLAMRLTQPWRSTLSTLGTLQLGQAVMAVSPNDARGPPPPRAHMPGQMVAMATMQRMRLMQAMGITRFMATTC